MRQKAMLSSGVKHYTGGYSGYLSHPRRDA
ncbi:hypothetical protein SPHINGOAX6_30106 [Sphingomonas sp. AX6]|nr:hypothetical protein SPHINGOAX6_30106 [Sphingomonas sp. AX6]